MNTVTTSEIQISSEECFGNSGLILNRTPTSSEAEVINSELAKYTDRFNFWRLHSQSQNVLIWYPSGFLQVDAIIAIEALKRALEYLISTGFRVSGQFSTCCPSNYKNLSLHVGYVKDNYLEVVPFRMTG